MIKGIIVGIVLTLVVGAFLMYQFFASGRAPVAVTDPPLPFEMKLAHMALDAHIDKAPKADAPFAPDETAYLAGVQVYKDNCAVCHGLPDQAPTAIAQGMFPRPPQLFKGVGVTDDPATETHWKVENGIRLTGMPGFKGRLTDAQMWQVSLLLANADKIPASVKGALAPSAGIATPLPGGDGKTGEAAKP